MTEQTPTTSAPRPRRAKAPDGVMLSTRISTAGMESLDELAVEWGSKRSDVVRELLRGGAANPAIRAEARARLRQQGKATPRAE